MTKSELPSVTVIVLTYNGEQHLKECFDSLGKVEYPADRLELLLINNGASDAVKALMEMHYPQVRVIHNAENLGFARANNQGAQEAASQYVLFLNDDMWVEPAFVRALVESVEQEPDVVAAGAKILDWDGTHIDFADAAAHFAGYAYQPRNGDPIDPAANDARRPVLYVCGGAMLIDRQVFLDVGGFDEDYFALYEDFDLGWRLWILGYRLVLDPRAIVHHRHHGTLNKTPNYRKQMSLKHNALASVIKNYDDENLGRILPAVLLGTTNGVIEQAIRRNQLDPATYELSAEAPARPKSVTLDPFNASALVAQHKIMAHLPALMAKRREIQARRKRSDREIAHLFRWPFRFWPGVSDAAQYALLDAFGVQALFDEVPRRVLVISSDILPYPGMPTVGSGLRAWGIGQGLKHRGHDVVFSMPRAALKDRRDIAPPEAIELAWEHHTLANVIRAAQPDVVVVCNWPVMALVPTELVHVPVILDQHGPHFMEREYQNFGDPDENAHYKLTAMRKADAFTCAGEKQLGYFQSWLERAGWTERERRERSAAIPVSLSPDLPPRAPADDLRFVYGGVFLPWQDPALGLSLLIETMERHNRGTLYFFGGKHPVYTVNSGIFEQLLEKLKESEHVVAPGMVSHDELIERYTQAHVAIDLMKRNPERELAFTTRTVEYLWCGLPVIYNHYSELSDYIREYDAGWVLDPEDREGIVAVLEEIFAHPEIVAQKSRNAQRLARERLNWDTTIEPLDHFVRHPSMRAHQYPKQQQAAVTRNARYLLNEAWSHYRRSGLSGLWKESWAFLKRQFGLY